MQGWLNLCKTVHIIQYINRIKDKNHIIISIYAEKALDKNPVSFHDKRSEETRARWNIDKYKKDYVQQTIANIILNEAKQTIFSKIRNKTNVSTLPTLIQESIRITSQSSKARERNKRGDSIGEEKVKLPLLTDGMFRYLKDPKNAAKDS
jgi:non-homologous end joining protein Ku